MDGSKVVLIGGALLAYLWYRQHATTAAAASTPAGPSTTTHTMQDPTLLQPRPPSTSAAVPSMASQVLALAGNGPLTADQWNWYWSKVSGVPQTTDLFPANSRQALLSMDQYLAARAAAGLSGYGRAPWISGTRWRG